MGMKELTDTHHSEVKEERRKENLSYGCLSIYGYNL